MAYSIQTAVSDGTLEVLDLSIKYMDKSHIFVYVDDVLVDGSAYSYVWLTDTRIQVVPAVANGSTIKVIRKTLTDEMWHEFSKGARFSTTSMDENFEQLLFLAQEYSEGIYVSDFYTDIDVHLKRILNLGDPIQDGDAVNLKTLKEYLPNADLLPPLVERIAAEEAKSARLDLQGIPTGDKVIVGFDGSALEHNAWVHFSGRDTVGDGFGGPLRFLAGSTITPSGDMVYAVPGGRLVRDLYSSAFISYAPAGTGAVVRSQQDKLRERVTPKDYGVVADGIVDDTNAWRAWIAACAELKAGFICHERLTTRITGKLVFPLVLISMPGGAKALPIDLRYVEFLYDGPRNDIAIDIGTAPGASGYWPESDIFLPRIAAAGAVQWPGALGTTDIGIRLRQVFRCRVHENFTYGFTNGIVYSGCAYNTVIAKHISDSKFGLVYTTEGSNIAQSFTNENTRIGGKIGNTSAVSALGNAFQVVFTWDKVSSYRGHNANRFIAPCFESNGSATYQMPIWFDGVGGINSFEHCRVEGDKGPIGLFDGGGGSRACGTTIHLDYIAYSGQEISLRQVNGACGNVLTGAGCSTDSWNSGDLAKLVTSAGAAGTAHLRGKELFFINAGTPTANDFRRTETAVTTAIKANRNGVHLDSGGYARIAVAIDTSRIKDFECSFDTIDGFVGRPYFMALNAQGQLLTGSAVETFTNPLTGAAYANEFYVKGTTYTGDSGQTLVVSATNGYGISADVPVGRVLKITVRPEVAVLIFSVMGASTQAVVKSLSVRAFATLNRAGEALPTANGRAALRVFSLVDDDGSERVATAKPDTAGTLGYYPRGAVVFNRNAESAQPSGWQCSAAGWLCPNWAASTSYPVPGSLVINDTGKVYELTTPGTSASSGGPTGTTATWDGITDGTAKWRYIGTKATFVAMPNNP